MSKEDLKIRLTDEMKTAMKAKDKIRLGVVRMLLSEVKRFEVDNPDKAGDSKEQLRIIGSYQKNLTKSLAEYPEDRRAELQGEIDIVAEFLPKQLSDEELKKEIQAEVQVAETKEFGPLMKIISTKLNGQADGRRISAVLKELL